MGDLFLNLAGVGRINGKNLGEILVENGATRKLEAGDDEHAAPKTEAAYAVPGASWLPCRRCYSPMIGCSIVGWGRPEASRAGGGAGRR